MSVKNTPGAPIESGLRAGVNWLMVTLAAILTLVVLGIIDQGFWAVAAPMVAGLIGFAVGASMTKWATQ